MRRALTLVMLLGAAGAMGAGCSASPRSEVAPSDTGTSRPPAREIDEVDDDPNAGSSDADKPQGKDGGAVPEPDTDAPQPTGPYAAVETLNGQALRDGLHAMIASHISLGYDAARDAMLGVTGQFDLAGGQLECIYTGKKVAPDGTRTPNGFNTEHSWPQSLGASSEPARSDLHHLFPVDEFANGARGNLPFADTDCGGTACSFEAGGSRRGPIIGGSDLVFQVRPGRRGDVARAIFYFAVRYERPLDAAEETALRYWSDADPPDATEIARNDAIEVYQHNRNPFVDRPDFIGRITDF